MTETVDGPQTKGFILMPFEDDLEWLHQAIKRAGTTAGCRMERADDVFCSGVIIEQVRGRIDEADAVVAVCTDQNPNVFFEMGLAWPRRYPILVAESTRDLPFDVRHVRTLLYGGTSPSECRATLEERLAKAISETAAEPRLPVGRRLDSSPERSPAARVSARMTGTGGGRKLYVSNAGGAEIRELTFEFPPEASSFIPVVTGELPVDVLRPGEMVSFPVAGVMGGGKSNFDVHFAGVVDGSPFEQDVKVSA